MSLPVVARHTGLDAGTVRRAITRGVLVPDAIAEAGLRRPAMPLFSPTRLGEIAQLAANQTPRVAA